MAFKWSNFTGDPFAVTTISFGLIAWIISIAGAGASDQSQFPHFSWWGIVYQICVINIIFLLYLSGNIELYKFTLVGLVSIAFVYTTNSTNQLIYNSDSSPNLACAAGCILLSILNIIWIGYFGGHPESPTNQFIDSFSLKSSSSHLIENHEKNSSPNDDFDYKRYGSPQNLPNSNSQLQFQDHNLRQSQLTTNQNVSSQSNKQYMVSSQLNGLENFSSSDLYQRDLTANSQKRMTSTTFNENSGTLSSIPYRYKAKALYSYDANPDDINEISFVKDEILEVDDIDGKWWQARKSNGQVGICPSNYVKLLQ